MALLIEETTNQAESQQIKSNWCFGDWGKPEHQGKISQNRVEYQQPQTQSTSDARSANQTLGHIGGKSLNYHRERFRKLTFRALALRQCQLVL